MKRKIPQDRLVQLCKRRGNGLRYEEKRLQILLKAFKLKQPQVKVEYCYSTQRKEWLVNLQYTTQSVSPYDMLYTDILQLMYKVEDTLGDGRVGFTEGEDLFQLDDSKKEVFVPKILTESER